MLPILNMETVQSSMATIEAVTIRDDVSHWSKTVFSSQDGFYEIRDIVPEATYAVTPFLSGYTFDPPRRVYENLAQDFEDQDFTAAGGALDKGH